MNAHQRRKRRREHVVLIRKAFERRLMHKNNDWVKTFVPTIPPMLMSIDFTGLNLK